MPLTLHIATIFSISIIGMRLLKIRNCFVILIITLRESSKMRGPIMLKQLVALLHLGSREFWRICNSVLNRGESTIPPLFNGPEALAALLTKLTSLPGIFHEIPPLTMVPNSFPFPPRTEQRFSSKNITAKMGSPAIYDLDASKATASERIPAIVLKMCSPELSPWPNLVFLPAGNLHRLCQFDGEVSIVL